MEHNKIGELLLNNITERNFQSLNELFHNDVRGRLLIPSALITTYDASDLIGKMKQWFGDSDHFELLDSKISSVGSSLGVKYRFKVHEKDGWFEVEQQTFSKVEAGKIKSFNLLCSGFQEIKV